MRTVTKPPTTEWCVPYCRVSSDRQAAEEKGSLDQQERDGLAKAKAAGLAVLYVVKDAESAWVLDKRSKFQAVLADAKAGKFSVLIVDRMNRFTRSEDLGEYMSVMAALREAGVRVLFSSREYEESPTGQLLQTVDAYVSGQEQANRRKQALVGKRTRVRTRHQPNPGSWSRYGYVWTNEKKTLADFDPGDAQAIVRRIWGHFLTGEHPTLSGTAKRLSREGVAPPRVYAGITRAKNAAKNGPRWNPETVRGILTTPIYWGGDEQGQVETFTASQYDAPVAIPAYAPAYVTREEAARVHARLTSNQRYATRRRKRAWPTLLHGGLARCAGCGWGLTPHEDNHVRADGSRLVHYRCRTATQRGSTACKGVNIQAAVLDYAVMDLLDQELNRGQFLDTLFAAWDQDAALVQGAVTSAARVLRETEQQVANQAARLATYAPGDPLAAPIEAHMRLLQQTLPGLAERHRQAQAAVTRAHNNPALRAELGEWFSAWLGGFSDLSREKQRDFLFAIGAQVTLWRVDARTPRAQLAIALPTSVATLPVAPADAPTPWTRDLDLAEGQALVAAAREAAEIEWIGPQRGPSVWETGTAEEALEAVKDAIATSPSRPIPRASRGPSASG
jgi:DNA invertase Pin-like site-specific DNA recombinase